MQKPGLLSFLFFFCTSALLPAAEPAAQKWDVVVYGGTAGGVVAAISAAREGAKVALLESGQHIGGMVTGGLSRTDIVKRSP